MSYYDHAILMACRLGPWAKRTPTAIDRDIEEAAMLQQRLNPGRPAIRTAARRLFGLFARAWNRRFRLRPGRPRKHGGAIATRCQAYADGDATSKS